MLHNLVTAYLFVPKIMTLAGYTSFLDIYLVAYIYFMKQYLKWVDAYLHEYWYSSSLYRIRPKSTTQALTAPIPACIPHL